MSEEGRSPNFRVVWLTIVGVLADVKHMRLALAGIAIGVLAALALSRTLSSLLFGVTAADPITFVAVGALFLAVAFAASYVPARRAARVDPMATLRGE